MRGFNDKNTVYLESGHFNTDEEAKEWGAKNSTGKYGYKNITVGGKDVILCETNMAYEDEVWAASEKIYNRLLEFLPESTGLPTYWRDKLRGDNTDAISDIRDYIISCFEKYENVRFLNVFNEY